MFASSRSPALLPARSRRGAPVAGLVALLASLLGSACAAPPAAPSSAVPPPKPPAQAPATTPSQTLPAQGSAALMDNIRNQIGAATCSSSSQCRSIAVGAKACGGPEAYLAWSTSVSNETRLKAAVAAHAGARRREDEQSGRISNCMLLTDPGARCDAGRCQLNPPGGGHSAPVM